MPHQKVGRICVDQLAGKTEPLNKKTAKTQTERREQLRVEEGRTDQNWAKFKTKQKHVQGNLVQKQKAWTVKLRRLLVKL